MLDYCKTHALAEGTAPSKNLVNRLGVGIIGLEPGRSWASSAHVPALRSLSGDFEIVGVANTSLESAQRAAISLDIPTAFESAKALIMSDAVDLVLVTVKVPFHKEIVSAAIAAGKHVYCEWPLGNGLAEARHLADLADAAGVIAVAGLQATMAPEVRQVERLVQQGYVGDLLSSSLVAAGTWFGPTVDEPNAYTLDDKNGATMLTIGVGHCLAAIEQVLPRIVKLSAVLATRRPTAVNELTGALVQRRSADQVVIAATLANGAPLSIYYRGGAARGMGLTWSISGTQGDLLIEGPGGHPQSVALSVTGGAGNQTSLHPLALPSDLTLGTEDGPMVGNVRRMYHALAQDVAYGTRSAPDFADAVRIHRILDAVQRAATSGEEVSCSP